MNDVKNEEDAEKLRQSMQDTVKQHLVSLMMDDNKCNKQSKIVSKPDEEEISDVEGDLPDKNQRLDGCRIQGSKRQKLDYMTDIESCK